MTGITSAHYICMNDNYAKVSVIKSLEGQMGTKRSVRRLALFVVAMIIPMIASFGAYASDAEDRAAALTGTIDWVRQTGDDKVVPQDMCARFLLICGTDGATFKFKTEKARGGVVRSFMWLGGRTALLTQTKRRAIYFVLDPSGAVVRIAVMNRAGSNERKIENDDPAFDKLLALEISFWQTQIPNGQ